MTPSVSLPARPRRAGEPPAQLLGRDRPAAHDDVEAHRLGRPRSVIVPFSPSGRADSHPKAYHSGTGRAADRSSMSVTARSVLVTGASAGIGRACADRLHAAGWTVTGASRRGTASAGWTGLVMDVDDDESVRSGVASVLEASGRIDAVVAAAGWGLAGAVES